MRSVINFFTAVFVILRNTEKIFQLLINTSEQLEDVSTNISLIIKHLKIMGAKTDQALQDLGAIKTQIGKIGAESSTMLEKIKALEEAANNTDTPQEVLDAIADVKAQAQVVDDLVPDSGGGEETPPPTEEPPIEETPPTEEGGAV